MQDTQLLKLQPEYREGHQLGSKGTTPPVDLNRTTRPKIKRGKEHDFLIKSRDDPFSQQLIYHKELSRIHDPREDKVETEVDSSRAAFRLGYVDGLQQFMDEKGIHIVSTGLFQGVSVLGSDDGLLGFVRGIKLEEPTIPRNYNVPKRNDLFEKYRYSEPEPKWMAEQRFRDMHVQEGYKIGFVVGVARETGVVLTANDVQLDTVAYSAFKDGMEGKPRDLPLGTRRTSDREWKFMLKDESPVVAQMRAYELFDTQAYSTGLRVWLASQGITSVETWQVRHPEALRAFKAALRGETLSEYEPRPVEHSRYDPLKSPYLERKENPFRNKFDMEPTPFEIARQQGHAAYNLGKRVRSGIKAPILSI